ncbi:hypothetical protein D3C72_1971060 [compost metagenome]
MGVAQGEEVQLRHIDAMRAHVIGQCDAGLVVAAALDLAIEAGFPMRKAHREDRAHGFDAGRHLQGAGDACQLLKQPFTLRMQRLIDLGMVAEICQHRGARRGAQ